MAVLRPLETERPSRVVLGRGARGERSEPAAQIGFLDLGQRGGQRLVAGALLRADTLGEDLDPRAVGLLDGQRELLELGQVHVGVAALPERVGQRLDVGEDVVQRLAREAWLVDLEHGAQPPGGDAHVVDALDVGGVEHAFGMIEELLGAHGDRAGGRLAVAQLRVQPRDVARLGHLQPPFNYDRRVPAGQRLRQAAQRDLQRRFAERSPGRLERQQAHRQHPDALDGEPQPLGRLGGGLGDQDRKDARDRRRHELTPGGRRQRRGAAPHGQDHVGHGRVHLERDVDLGAHRGQLVERGRIGAQVAGGQRPGADRQRGPPGDAVARGARHELDEPPPTSITPIAPAGGGASVASAPAKASVASCSLAEDLDVDARGVVHRRAEVVAVARAADRLGAHGPDLAHAVLVRPAHVRGHDRGQLGDRLGGNRAVVTGDQTQEAAHGDELAHPRVRRAPPPAGGSCWCRCQRTRKASGCHHSIGEHFRTCHSRPRPAQGLRRTRGREGPGLRSRPRRGLRPARPQRRREDHDGRDPRGLSHANGRDRLGARTRSPAAFAGLRERVGIVLQSTGMYRHITPREALGHFAHFYPHPRDVEEVIAITGLQEKADAYVRTLSGGQRRRLDLALALIGDPELIFLDEPTTGFDPAARRNAWEVIRSLQELGKTILLTTHYLDEAQALCDRVAIVKEGRIVAEGPPGELGAASTRYRWRGATRTASSRRARSMTRRRCCTR